MHAGKTLTVSINLLYNVLSLYRAIVESVTPLVLFVIKVLWARVNHHIYLYVLLIESLRLHIRTKRTKMLGSVGPGKKLNVAMSQAHPHLWSISFVSSLFD